MGRTRILHRCSVGQVHGNWEVTELVREPKDNHNMLKCTCSCGTVKIVRESSVLCGDSTSCGCVASTLAGDRLRTHGLSLHPLYSVLSGMKRRCYRVENEDYHHYGGRGITICERWLDAAVGLQNFIEDMGSTYMDGLEIDRIDNNGNYEPSNCRWATRRTQVINRRQTGSPFDAKLIEYEGKTLCISEWADEVGIPAKVLIDRLGKLGWNFKKAITTNTRPKRYLVSIDGVRQNLKEFFTSNKLNYQYFSNYKTNHTMKECCEKFLRGFSNFMILGEYDGKLVLLHDSNIN